MIYSLYYIGVYVIILQNKDKYLSGINTALSDLYIRLILLILSNLQIKKNCTTCDTHQYRMSLRGSLVLLSNALLFSHILLSISCWFRPIYHQYSMQYTTLSIFMTRIKSMISILILQTQTQVSLIRIGIQTSQTY